MAVVDQFGRPVTIARTFAHAADQNRSRGPQFYDRNASIEELIPRHDRNALVGLSKRLFTNMGAPMRAAIAQKADYSVGSAWIPIYGGKDKEVGDEVCSWLKNVWFPMCDVRGGGHDWHRLLKLTSTGLDREGEVFVMLTTDRSGEFPRLQQVPSYLVRSAFNGPVKMGPYKGLRIHDGVIYNAQNAAVAYRVYSDQTNFKDISARDLIHDFDPTYQEQGRGLPAFTHALDDMKMMLQSTEYERIKQQVISSILLVEKNELGGPDYTDPAVAISTNASDGTGIAQETYGPAVHYFKSNSDNGLEAITHNSPGDVWESFHDRMIRSALAPLWSYSLVWKAQGQGTAERSEVLKARRFVAARIKSLKYIARRASTYAVGVAVAAGRIPQPGNMRAFDFTEPPRLTVDDGREAKAMTESHAAGHINETEIQGHKGKAVEDHYRERAVEEARKQIIRQEVETEYGVEIGPEAMGNSSKIEPQPPTNPEAN